jgi:predicted transposase YdaD
LVILDPAATPAEARALSTERKITAAPLETLDLIETILVSKCPHGSRKEIRDMLQLPITDVKKTCFYQEVFAEGRDEAERAVIQ